MLRIHSPYLPLLRKQGLNDLDALWNRFVPSEVKSRGGVLVKRDSILDQDQSQLDVHFKLYHFKSPSWRFWGRPSKAALEFRNYGILQGLGIACADPIACGEQRDFLGRLRRAFILTKTVPNSATLEDFLDRQPADLSKQEQAARRRALLLEVAAGARRIHETGFFHHDLVWRNILVTPEAGAWSTRWIDCPRGGFATWACLRHRSRLRDLGSFDKSAARQCNRADRLRAFLRYAGRENLDADSKRLIRQVLEYRRLRWPDDWPTGNTSNARPQT